MKKRVLAAVLFVAVLLTSALVAACGSDNGKVPTGAIAAVGDGVITKAAFDKIIAQAKVQAKAAGQPFPEVGSYSYNQYAARVIDYLVQQKIIEQQAQAWDIKVTDAQVKDRVTQIEQAYGGAKKIDEMLDQQGMTRADLNDLMREQLLSQKVFDRVTKDVKVTDAAAKAYYEKNESQYVQPETRDIRHILVKTKAEAEKVRALLVADPSTANWKKLAKQYSDDPGSKGNGGQLGPTTPGAMVPAFDKAAFALKKNEISQPVKTQFGWHVIQVTKIVKAATTPFEKAKDGIKAQLLQTKRQAAWQKWIEEQEKLAKVAYAEGFDPAKLKATKPETTSPSPAPTQSVSPSTSASPKSSPSPSSTK